jgi:hypothetical protein
MQRFSTSRTRLPTQQLANASSLRMKRLELLNVSPLSTWARYSLIIAGLLAVTTRASFVHTAGAGIDFGG